MIKIYFSQLLQIKIMFLTKNFHNEILNLRSNFKKFQNSNDGLNIVYVLISYFQLI
jgi:hypothetical protein